MLLGSFFGSIKILERLKDKSILNLSNHVQSDNENFIRVSGSPICHLHMSTFLNVCVPSLSLFPTFIFHGLFD
jgi:hypothetical protein